MGRDRCGQPMPGLAQVGSYQENGERLGAQAEGMVNRPSVRSGQCRGAWHHECRGRRGCGRNGGMAVTNPARGRCLLDLMKCAHMRETYHTVPEIGLESPGVSSRGGTGRSFLECGREHRCSSTTLPLTVLTFSDTLVPIRRRGEPIGPTSGEPVTRTCSLGRERDS